MTSTTIAQEDYLQNYIHNNPESLPIDEIEEDLRLLILSREFPTGSGPIDALGIDQQGNIYVVETKLHKNPDKRLVLAQVLDYGASLWHTYSDETEFFHRLEEAVVKTFGASLNSQVQNYYGLDPEGAAAVLKNISQNLRSGKFRFVVLMNHLEDRLKQLITFVNQNSRFDIYGVELDFYAFQDYEIVIPKMYGTEVKKSVGGQKTSAAGRKWDEESFLSEAAEQVSDEVLTGMRELCEFSSSHGKPEFGRGQTPTFNPKFVGVSTLAPYSLRPDGTLILNFKWVGDDGRSGAIMNEFGQGVKSIQGFDLPDDYVKHDVPIPPMVWVPQIKTLIEVIRTTLIRQ